MAKITLEHPIQEVHGAFTRKGIIHRQKKYRDEEGRIILEGQQEAYVIKHPRDFKKNPPKGAELAHQNRWREACHRAAQILQAGQADGLTDRQRIHRQINSIPDYYTPEEASALFAAFKARFQAQLPSLRGKHPDPQAPINPATGSAKRYVQLPAFIRAMIYSDLRGA